MVKPIQDLTSYRLLTPFLFCLLCSCSTVKTKFDDWSEVGYPGFGEKVMHMAGNDAVNCGFHPLHTGVAFKDAEDGLLCAKKAYDLGQAFMFGATRVPYDSYWHEVYIRDQAGEYYQIIYDVMIDGTWPQLWISQCKDLVFTMASFTLAGDQCQDLTDYTW